MTYNEFSRKVVLFVSGLLLLGGMLYYITFGDERTFNATVSKIDKITSVQGTDGDVFTSTYYLVYTNRGTYSLNLSGVLAYPEALPLLQEGKSVRMTVCGVRCKLLGIYSSISKITEACQQQ